MGMTNTQELSPTYRNPDGTLCPGGDECTGDCLRDYTNEDLLTELDEG